ncbi:MAG: hypothetical protein WA021_03330 [Minisyncoccia bacterium]
MNNRQPTPSLDDEVKAFALALDAVEGWAEKVNNTSLRVGMVAQEILCAVFGSVTQAEWQLNMKFAKKFPLAYGRAPTPTCDLIRFWRREVMQRKYS